MAYYKHLSQQERKRLYSWVQMGLGIKDIAKKLRRHRSTIYRELKRNSVGKYYLPYDAHRKYIKRRGSIRPKIQRHPVLYGYILRHLKMGWSPEQISGSMRLKGKDYFVCHETIYRFIYGYNSKKLYQYLYRAKPRRGPRWGRKVGSGKYKGIKLIHERPLEANDRHFGHWEGDTVHFGTVNQLKNISTLVERKTRYVHIIKNQNLKSKHVLGQLEELINRQPRKAWKSITVDQGSEFADYRSLEIRTRCKVYFCEPHSPWQKGSNENMNRRIRQYLPRTSKIENISQQELDDLADKLNNIPRKCLGYLTPKQALLKECGSYSRTSL